MSPLPKIVIIEVDSDFTPPGKRNARIITTSSGKQQLRWYVSGRIHRRLAPTAANIRLTREWMAA